MNDIFQEWKLKPLHKDKLFITDGVIDESLWNSSENKIMFLLKEAYDSKRSEGSWDLPKLIKRKGASGRTFKPMAQWAYGVSEVMQSGDIASYKQSGEKIKDALFSSAVVNLKKSQGKSKSRKSDLEKYVNEDWKLIDSQIKDINPKVVLCGNTWSLVKDKIPHTKISDRVYQSDGLFFVDFWHPSNRASNAMSYYSLCAIVQLALKQASYNK